MMTTKITSHSIRGGQNVSLQLLKAGQAGAPSILFLHGFSQSAWVWQKQLQGALAQDHALWALELRGHGQSDKPIGDGAYSDSQAWADDVRAAIEATGADTVSLVAWSYGGLVACDYVRHYGSDRVNSLTLVGALTKLGSDAANALLNPSVFAHIPGIFATDVQTSVASLTGFIQSCFAKPLSGSELHTQLGANCLVPPEVRLALFSRSLDNDDLLKTLAIPTLLVHGADDGVVLPSASEHIANLVAGAQAVVLERIGHTPFYEDSAGFDQRLREFVAQHTASATV